MHDDVGDAGGNEAPTSGDPDRHAALAEDGKEVRAYRIGGVRPLQLPTINKRHRGSYWAEH
eukprot:10047991-Lingulodinium_polyedra.AAC.1